MKIAAKVFYWIYKKLHKKKQLEIQATNSTVIFINIHKG